MRRTETQEDLDAYFLLLQQGEEEGFSYFFRLYYDGLTVFALSLTRNIEQAQDLAEDAFAQLWQQRDKLVKAGALKAYLYVTVRNGYIDSLRKRKLHLSYISHKIRQLSFAEPHGMENLLRAEFYTHLHRLQHNLTQNQQRVLELYYQEGKNLTEIARELGLAISTVKSYKKLALDYIRANLPSGLKEK